MLLTKPLCCSLNLCSKGVNTTDITHSSTPLKTRFFKRRFKNAHGNIEDTGNQGESSKEEEEERSAHVECLSRSTAVVTFFYFIFIYFYLFFIAGNVWHVEEGGGSVSGRA
jgi:hypothetical protein